MIKKTKQKRTQETKKVPAKSVLIAKWSARILPIVFGVFLIIFSLDAFGSGRIAEQLEGFIIHNVPSMVIGILVFFAWKKDIIGGIGFLALGVLFTIFFHSYRDIISFSIVSLPMLLAGGLFMLAWHLEKQKN